MSQRFVHRSFANDFSHEFLVTQYFVNVLRGKPVKSLLLMSPPEIILASLGLWTGSSASSSEVVNSLREEETRGTKLPHQDFVSLLQPL